MPETENNKHVATMLAIAGSDSIGGAGMQADIKAAWSADVYPMTCITSITAQNTQGVSRSRAVDREMLMAQLCTVLEDVRPDAVKIGMLPTEAAVAVVADVVRTERLHNIVLDPVMVATSGDELTSPEAVKRIMSDLLPLVDLVTPNLDEARVLADMEFDDYDSTIEAARRIVERCRCKAVLIKGGHSDNPENLDDILFMRTPDGEEEVHVISHRRIDTRNTHGTGCTLSSAIAARLAQGMPLVDAVQEAIMWLHIMLEAGRDVEFGHGHGPALLREP